VVKIFFEEGLIFEIKKAANNLTTFLKII